MINQINRNHWIYIIQNLISMIKSNLFLFIIVLTTKKGIYYIAAIIILMIGISILNWRKTIFYINDDLLVSEKGIISKSKEEIPFNKINTIDVGQTLLGRIFNIFTMKIDTGSAVAQKSELKIISNYKVVEELRKIILTSKKIKTNQSNEYIEKDIVVPIVEKVITNREILKYTLTKNKLGWAIGGFFLLNNVLDDLAKFFNTSFSKFISKNMNVDFIKTKTIATSIVILIGFMLFLYILITILSIIFETIRLYNFTVKSDKEKISISYGLLNKKEYSFNIDKIYGLRYKQSILQQILNIYTVEIITIGYGDEENENALLYPIAEDNFKNEFIKKLLPNLTFEGELNKPPKSSLRRFILKKLIIWLIILIPAYVFIKFIPSNIKLSIIILILCSSLILGYLNYKNTSLGVSKDSLIASTGAFLKTTTIIRQDTLQSITKKQGIFQKMGKVCDYKIDLYSNTLGDIIHVKHMDENVYEKLQQNLTL
ncbi:bacterial membrane flanked domain protein [Clostridium acetireducens DSM 10703]|uniref:Bacterial membrane flanked domain protein n=1 Tax=Clostridium acetireducens DSM 10703 TaxID=1121290 RepID=A0A1E8F1Q5_9CLOT|nr:PH domain-containing protein [Clostridium acetireducens]OFI07540.1 bacterial membrane flanked domain protein [Clostridium acetireducens DSM 10703]